MIHSLSALFFSPGIDEVLYMFVFLLEILEMPGILERASGERAFGCPAPFIRLLVFHHPEHEDKMDGSNGHILGDTALPWVFEAEGREQPAPPPHSRRMSPGSRVQEFSAGTRNDFAVSMQDFADIFMAYVPATLSQIKPRIVRDDKPSG
jgi:hypothetical protein